MGLIERVLKGYSGRHEDFNYQTLLNLLNSGERGSANKYCFQHYSLGEGNLKEKLGIIAGLEKDFGVLGVNFVVEPGARVLTSDAIDYVLGFICDAIQITRDKEKFPILQAPNVCPALH